MTTTHFNAIIVGGGAAGFFSAIHHKEMNPAHQVLLLEKSKEVLSKVKISGGGRCNVTHACFDPRTFCEHYPRGQKELLGPMTKFGAKQTVEWFKNHGVELKTEADNRMFPLTNTSQTIVDCLLATADKLGVKLWTECGVKSVENKNNLFYITLDTLKRITCDKLVLATGSSRGGHELAKQLGHHIVPPVPSLFTFNIADKALHELSGVSVQKAQVWLASAPKQRQMGPILITHWGLSGPAIIKLSAWQARSLAESGYKATLLVCWLPEHDPEELSPTLKKMSTQHPKKSIASLSPFPEFSTRLWTYLLSRVGLGPTLTWAQIGEKEKQKLTQLLSQDQFEINGKSIFKEEFVTCGGVSLKEVSFKNMESRICPGLHLVGELLDIDGITGGFNFQNAWTTAYLSAPPSP